MPFRIGQAGTVQIVPLPGDLYFTRIIPLMIHRIRQFRGILFGILSGNPFIQAVYPLKIIDAFFHMVTVQNKASVSADNGVIHNRSIHIQSQCVAQIADRPASHQSDTVCAVLKSIRNRNAHHNNRSAFFVPSGAYFFLPF